MTKILVIDDSQMMRRIMRSYLEAEGFEVEDWLPLSPMEIPDRLRESKPDLVLSDFQMPGLNGLSVAQMVQRTQADLPVMVLTALRDPDTEAKLAKFGVKRVLHKPIDQETLAQAVREVLG